MQENAVDWLEQGAAGPVVVVANDVVGHWQGVGDDVFGPHDAFGPDYVLACTATDYVEVMSWRGREILVIGEMPTPIHVRTSEGVAAIFQWYHAPSLEVASSAVCLWAPPETGCVCDLIWRPGAAECVLFEASCAADESDLAVPIVLPADTLRVQTFEYKPNEETFLIVHVLRGVSLSS